MSLEEIIDALGRICNESVPAGKTNVYAEFRLIRDGDEVREAVLGANRDGLIFLAIQCLKLAETGLPGSQYHFDEAGGAALADIPLVVARRRADWEEQDAT